MGIKKSGNSEEIPDCVQLNLNVPNPTKKNNNYNPLEE